MFRTAFFAVAVHTPAEQFMFCVGFDEISTAALDVVSQSEERSSVNINVDIGW